MTKKKKSKTKPSGRPAVEGKDRGKLHLKGNRRPQPRRAAPPLSQDAVTLPATVVQSWQDAVLALAKLPRGTSREETPEARLHLALKQETPVIAELWETFTQERKDLSRHLLGGRRQVVAYLLGFHLANAARMQLALERLDARARIGAWLEAAARSGARVRFHDLGCGTGALSQVFSAFALARGLPKERLEVNLVDLNAGLLDAAKETLTRIGVEPRTHKVPLEKLPLDRYAHEREDTATTSVYGLGYVWNETARNPAARARLAKLFAGAVERGEKALVFLLEPATQELCRDAMALRDELVAASWSPLYPCPAATACPMLQRTRDWCFSEGHWRQPRAMLLLDDKLGLDRARFSSTIMVFATPALARELASPHGVPVVVGRPQRGAAASGRGGKPNPAAFDYLLCHAGELKKSAPQPGKPFLLRGTTLTEREPRANPRA